MKSFARLGSVLGIGTLGLVVVMAGPQIAPRMGLQSAEAAALPPLAGTWLPVQGNAPIMSLHITVQTAFNIVTNTIERHYVVDAAGRHGNLGTATVPVPASPTAQVEMIFHSTPCQPLTPHCVPSSLPSTTDLIIAPGHGAVSFCSAPCRYITTKYVTHSAAGTDTGGEYMTQVS